MAKVTTTLQPGQWLPKIDAVAEKVEPPKFTPQTGHLMVPTFVMRPPRPNA